MAKKETHDGAAGAFWSGTITFGLVSIQVDLYSAHRPKSAALRMVDRNGTPLHRRYVCPRDHKPLEGKDIVRGYEIEEGEYILVTDEELEGLEPKKSREIDLRSYVDVSELDPVYFEPTILSQSMNVQRPWHLRRNSPWKCTATMTLVWQKPFRLQGRRDRLKSVSTLTSTLP